MNTLAIVATKGGVGKTTIAVHLAVAAQRAGHKTMVFDLDPQGSASQWAKQRAKWAQTQPRWYDAKLDVRRVFADELAEARDEAEGEGFEFLIIDTPPHADFPAARAVEIADIVLMPTRPSYFDLHAAKSTIKLVTDMRADAYFVISQVPHNSARIADDARAFLEPKGIKPTPMTITALQPYSRALKNGLTAPELAPGGRHDQEIATLWTFLQMQLSLSNTVQPASGTKTEPAPSLDDPFADFLGLGAA